jgi:hypothetical protein
MSYIELLTEQTTSKGLVAISKDDVEKNQFFVGWLVGKAFYLAQMSGDPRKLNRNTEKAIYMIDPSYDFKTFYKNADKKGSFTGGGKFPSKFSFQSNVLTGRWLVYQKGKNNFYIRRTG